MIAIGLGILHMPRATCFSLDPCMFSMYSPINMSVETDLQSLTQTPYFVMMPENIISEIFLIRDLQTIEQRPEQRGNSSETLPVFSSWTLLLYINPAYYTGGPLSAGHVPSFAKIINKLKW